MSSGIFTRKAGELIFHNKIQQSSINFTRFSKAELISQDSASVRGAIGVLIKSLLLVLVKSHNLVLSWAIVTSKQSNTQANKKQAGKKRQIEKEREDRERGWIKRQGWSGGEENKRQMANNVMRGIRVCNGYLVCLDLCIDSSATTPEILLATSFSGALVFPEEEGMMQQSSVSISLSFWEPRYQSSRRLRASPSYLHKTNKSSQQMQIGVVNPFTVTYESEIW